MPFHIALCQINPHVGHIDHNLRKIIDLREKLMKNNPHIRLLIFSELVLSGYPPEDLILRPAFLDQIDCAVQKIVDSTSDGGPAILFGAPKREKGNIFNAAFLAYQGSCQNTFSKINLPNYGVFDEKRIFQSGDHTNNIFVMDGIIFGVLICEDMWTIEPAKSLKKLNADILISINASPYELHKEDTRNIHAINCVFETNLPLIYVNQCGGQDEIVFDGASFALNAQGKNIVQLPNWQESSEIIKITRNSNSSNIDILCVSQNHSLITGVEALYQALMTGLRDYIEKNNFSGVLIGLSGGIDSALTAAIAVDALGSHRVRLVMMPSPYTHNDSIRDAKTLSENLHIDLMTIPISNLMTAFDKSLQPHFDNYAADITEENLQSRIRGSLLMALSNKLGDIVISTGNKSEMAMGYATLYGDMCGGFALLKDIYKVNVFELCVWRNMVIPKNGLGLKGAIIPENIISKPPSAELKHNQKDEDTLPPYGILDQILKLIIEENKSFEDIVALDFDPQIIRDILNKLYHSEYKRRQAPPGVKVTSKSFGKERRYPITNGFYD